MNLFCIIFGTTTIIFSILYALDIFMPTTPKKYLNVSKDRINVSILILLAGIIIVLKGSIINYSSKAFTITMIIWLVICIIDLIIINKKYKKEVRKNEKN